MLILPRLIEPLQPSTVAHPSPTSEQCNKTVIDWCLVSVASRVLRGLLADQQFDMLRFCATPGIDITAAFPWVPGQNFTARVTC